ncbi:hypothetical protein TNCV_3076831 [Trichonephila clavipes]|nr:hypothetical protein TNCV_3076831 [Trichonephila clavipes]
MSQTQAEDAAEQHAARLEMSGKKKLCPQEALDFLQNLLSEIKDVLIDDFSDEKVPANNLLEFLLDS